MSTAALADPATQVLRAVDAGASAGPIGLFVIVAIGVSTVLLIRNMDKRVKRLPERFDPPGPDRDREPGPPGS